MGSNGSHRDRCQRMRDQISAIGRCPAKSRHTRICSARLLTIQQTFGKGTAVAGDDATLVVLFQ